MADSININNLVITQTQITTNTTSATTTTETQKEDGLFETTNVNETEMQTLTNTADKVNQLVSTGEALGLNLEGVDLADDLEDIAEYIEKLEQMLKNIENIIQTKTEELALLEHENEVLLKEEASQNARLDELNAKYEDTTSSMDAINKNIEEINSANEEAHLAYLAKYNSLSVKAESEYNAETDGDKDAFIASYMSGLSAPTGQDTTSLSSQYADLSSTASDLELSINLVVNSTLPNIQSKLQSVQGKIAIKSTEVQNAQNDKTTIKSEQDAMPQKKVDTIKSYISDEEWALITANNIDMSQTFEDGSLKFMVAKGKSDGKYHIYEWDSADKTSATTLARKYAPGEGFDIVASGNGYLGLYNQNAEADDPDNIRTIQLSMNKEQTSADYNMEKATYVTSSPLAFDLDGMGIQTSKDKIMYDINGDGKLDEINNVLEGILAFDKDGDGIAGANASELFGNNTDLNGDGKADGYKDGFAALKALAANENLINGADDMVLDEKDISYLTQKFGLTMKVGGYNGQNTDLLSLGITSINLAATNETTLTDNFDGQGNQLMAQEGATFVQNGKTKEYVDVWNRHKVD